MSDNIHECHKYNLLLIEKDGKQKFVLYGQDEKCGMKDVLLFSRSDETYTKAAEVYFCVRDSHNENLRVECHKTETENGKVTESLRFVRRTF